MSSKIEMSRKLALLKEASEWIKANSFGGTDAVDLWERIDAQIEADDGFLTDDNLIEIAKQSAALCSEQHHYMDRALYLDWQPHKWVIDAMRRVATPVVERQPVAINENVEFEKWWCRTPVLRKGKLQIAQEAWEARAALSAPPELAELQATAEQPPLMITLADHKTGQAAYLEHIKELQATIARLTAENERLTSEPVLNALAKMLTEARLKIVDRDLEIERLKGGQREPVAYFDFKELERLKTNKSGYMSIIAYRERGALVSPLFASQPAPVEVLDGWKLVPINPTSSMLEAGKDVRMDCFTNPNLSVEGALIRIYSAIVEAAPACLDKVKELNQ